MVRSVKPIRRPRLLMLGVAVCLGVASGALTRTALANSGASKGTTGWMFGGANCGCASGCNDIICCNACCWNNAMGGSYPAAEYGNCSSYCAQSPNQWPCSPPPCSWWQLLIGDCP